MTDFELRYPIGKYKRPDSYPASLLADCIQDIERFPKKLQEAVLLLNDEQLDTPYREGGWTVRQVVHHCADSYMNSFIRFKWALTEEKPTIKAYFEDRWAELADSQLPIQPSLTLLDGLHKRWTRLLKSLDKQSLQRSFIHPESRCEISLEENITLYAWHCKHHLAHIINLKQRMNWK